MMFEVMFELMGRCDGAAFSTAFLSESEQVQSAWYRRKVLLGMQG